MKKLVNPAGNPIDITDEYYEDLFDPEDLANELVPARVKYESRFYPCSWCENSIYYKESDIKRTIFFCKKKMTNFEISELWKVKNCVNCEDFKYLDGLEDWHNESDDIHKYKDE